MTKEEVLELWSEVTAKEDLKPITLKHSIASNQRMLTSSDVLWAVEYNGKHYVFADEESYITDELKPNVHFTWGHEETD